MKVKESMRSKLPEKGFSLLPDPCMGCKYSNYKYTFDPYTGELISLPYSISVEDVKLFYEMYQEGFFEEDKDGV